MTKHPSRQPKRVESSGHSFVVHRHHASRLHYDLRLEENGVLRSWAVPKGMPPKPGIKRLAVATEDHPLEYLEFEGTIPKKQYGGGQMWSYAAGKYEITKEKKDGFYFSLKSPQLSGEFRIHNMKDKEWLLERVDNPQKDWWYDPVDPMLAQPAPQPPEGDYLFEVKWDGIRAIFILDEGELRIFSRKNLEITHLFPELLIPAEAFRATSAVFDGEIVCLDKSGKADFKRVVSRIQRRKESDINYASRKYPANCYLFDCLFLDGRSLLNEPLHRRREWLKDSIRRNTPYRFSETVEDGPALFEAAKGIRFGRYHGQREKQQICARKAKF